MKFQHATLRLDEVVPSKRQSLAALHAPGRFFATYNARGAVYQLLMSLAAGDTRRKVLLPAFHCVALVEPVVRTGYDVEFYRIREDFTIDLDDLTARLGPKVALVVAVHYFGFPVDLRPLRERCRAVGARLVEDSAHSFLSTFEGAPVGRQGDFAVFSYYKLVPSLVGGGLVANDPDYRHAFVQCRLTMRQQAVLTKRLVEQVAMNSPRNPLSVLLLWLESKRIGMKAGAAAIPIEGALTPTPERSSSAFVDNPYFFDEAIAGAEMPGISRYIIEACDWDRIAAARRDNFDRWAAALAEVTALAMPFPRITAGVVPWAFPVCLDGRIEHEQKLRGLGVPLFTFGETLHPTLRAADAAVRGPAETLSGRLFLLPVQHNLTAEIIAGFAASIVGYLKGCA